jgi:hypothetical protein
VNLTSSLCVASSESGPPPGTCRVCQRKGLPILVLREALVPKPASWLDPPRPPAEPAIAEMQKGCRILRAGYLYVLLDYSVWQAYQVSPDGYLRQFNPCAPPLADGQPLARACVQSDHDMPASLLNLDVDTYRTAALAFSDDPWPVSVLDHYKSGCNVARLQTIDLATARDTPNEIGDFLTAENTKVYDEVYEYAEFVPRFNSVHAFHSRGYRRQAMGNFLRTAPSCGSLGPGVLAIVLKDSVGLVQEYNGLRAQWAHARQVWLEEPERAYQHQTSQILLTIRALHRQWANAKVPTVPPTLPEGHFTTEHWKERRRGHVENEAVNSDKRLEERYDEPKRAAFQADYDYQLTAYQKQIDRYAALYAESFASPEFQYAMQHDYDGDDPSSGIAYSKTMSLCLRGGISEAADNDTGPTAQMWQKMLQDPHGPVYQALLMRDKNLLAGLLPTFSDTGVSDWNDSNKLYTVLTKAITSDEARHFMRPHLQESIAQVLAALNSANARLSAILRLGVGQAVSRLNSASQLLYNGIHLVEVQVRMTLGEYHALQSAHVRSLEQRLANSADRSNARPKIQPLIMGGPLTMAVLEPKLSKLEANVSVWIQGNVDDIKNALKEGVTSEWLDIVTQRKPTPLIVNVGTLDPQISKAFEEIKVTPLQAQTFVRKGFVGLSGISKSLDLLIAIGSLYLMNDAVNKSINSFKEVTGEKSTEASLALFGSTLAILGGGMELVGTALNLGVSTKPVSLSNPTSVTPVKQIANAGKRMVMRGSIIIATSGFIDAAIAATRSRQSLLAGDHVNAAIYTASSVVSSFGAYAGIVAAGARSAALIGPLGIAIVLGMVGYALFKWAERRESTPIERWVKRCYFGLHDKNSNSHWGESSSSLAAVLELNSVMLGVKVNVLSRRIKPYDHRFDSIVIRTSRPINSLCWQYKILLPSFDKSRSSYFWQFILHRRRDDTFPEYPQGQIVACGELGQRVRRTPAGDWHQSALLSQQGTSVSKNIRTTEANILEEPSSDKITALHNLIIQGSTEIIRDNKGFLIDEATLQLTYWPDSQFENICSETIWHQRLGPEHFAIYEI